VWALGSGWPDLVVAVVLLIMFMRSAFRVFGAARQAISQPASPA
jgi:hypothetical protein